MNKILILGDRESARWHPISNLNPLLNALRKEYDFTVTTEYSHLTSSCLESFDVCINYMDNWQERGSRETQEALCSYVEKGGKMLTLHNGIITKSSGKLLYLNGGTFMGHDEYGELEYRNTGAEPELLRGMESFCMKEEPYEYSFLRREEMNIFLEYRKGNQWYPAGWWGPYKKRLVVYLAPGHDETTFQNPVYIRQIRNALRFIEKGSES